MQKRTLSSALMGVMVALLLTGCAIGPHKHAGVTPTGRKPLTFDAIFGPDAVDFSGNYSRDLKWLPNESRYLHRRSDGVLEATDAETGQSQPAYNVEALEKALAEEPDISEERAHELALRPTEFSKDRSTALIEEDQQLYFYRFADHSLKKLTSQSADRRVLTIAPSNDRIAFALDNDLYTIDVATGDETRLTHDGSETLLNGVLDWVYQEEVFGRYKWRGYWWSDDGANLAYLQLDDANVPVYPLVDYLDRHPPTESQRYPQPGDPNPVARLGVVPATGGETVWLDMASYADVQPIIVHVSWSPDGRTVFAVQDREQTWLDLNIAQPEARVVSTLIHETSPAWATFHAPPHWLSDGTFLWLSSRDGWTHLYHYSADGELIRRLTTGWWEIRKLLGVDEAAGEVYFTGSFDTVLENQAYGIPLHGGTLQRLTTLGSFHDVNLNDTCRYFIDTYSNAATPPAVDLRRANGKLVRVISPGDASFLKEYEFHPPEFVEVPTPRYYKLNAALLVPQNQPKGKNWPVMLFTYAGPDAPTVRNRWGGKGEMFKQLLAQQGYCVWTVDPHSSSGESMVSAWQAYKRLGQPELEDLETSLRWLGKAKPVDLSRVGIEGHSFGGFMASYALTHSDMFHVGIAAAPVTDWRLYDSIYTERFMRTPANNPEGYEAASCVAAAAKVHGQLLLAHGMEDDNVHALNTYQLMNALQQADKTFDVMLYPRDKHGLRRNGGHWNRLRYDFIRQRL